MLHSSRRRLFVLAMAIVVAGALLWYRHRVGEGVGPEDAPSGGPVSAAGVVLAASATLPTTGASAGASSDAEWFVDRARAPRTLAGRVLLDGKPAAGIAVELVDAIITGGARPARRVASDDRGRFAFLDVPVLRGMYRVSAAPLQSEVAPAWEWIPGDATPPDLELRLESCRLHVYGTVSDASGGPIAGARVFWTGAPGRPVVTNASGDYRACSAPRSGRLRAEAAGYGAWSRALTPRGSIRQDITLMPAAEVAGSVYFAASGAAAAFAIATLRQEGGEIGAARADANGRFRFTDVAPGAYVVEARTDRTRSAPVEVAVFASAVADVRVPLEPRAELHGRVVLAENDTPVADARVTVRFGATSIWSSTVRTTTEGAFAVLDGPIGNRVEVTVDDYDVDAPRVTDVRDGANAELVVRVRAKGSLVVNVTRSGDPVRDANVTLRGPAGVDTRTAGVSNGDGVATLRGLGAGTYRLVVEHDGDFAVRESVQIARERTTMTVELSAGRTVSGRVLDEHGHGIDGARVDFSTVGSSADLGASATTAADGVFRGGPLRGPATFDAKVTRSGAPLVAKTQFPRISVDSAGNVEPRDLVLVVRALDHDLSGFVRDEQGGPIRDARITIGRVERHTEAIAETVTGDDGGFTVRGLGPGPFALKALASNGGTVEKKPVDATGETVLLTMPPVGTVRGIVRGFARRPTVMMWGVAGYDWDFHRPTIDEEGRFVISGVTRGRYYVSAANSNASASVTLDFDPAKPADITLQASEQRTVKGRTLEFVSGAPLPDFKCVAAPFVAEARSPVVVPGTVISGEDGSFVLADVPASDLYIWCWGDSHQRGGVARIPANLAEQPGGLVVWGLDPRGRSIDADSLGLSMDHDYPMSRRVVAVEPRSPAERSGVRAGDVLQQIAGKAMGDTGTGFARVFLAYVLGEKKPVPIVVDRGGIPTSLVFALE